MNPPSSKGTRANRHLKFLSAKAARRPRALPWDCPSSAILSSVPWSSQKTKTRRAIGYLERRSPEYVPQDFYARVMRPVAPPEGQALFACLFLGNSTTRGDAEAGAHANPTREVAAVLQAVAKAVVKIQSSLTYAPGTVRLLHDFRFCLVQQWYLGHRENHQPSKRPDGPSCENGRNGRDENHATGGQWKLLRRNEVLQPTTEAANCGPKHMENATFAALSRIQLAACLQLRRRSIMEFREARFSVIHLPPT